MAKKKAEEAIVEKKAMKQVSMSTRTSGSAFSLSDSEAEVCWMKTCRIPMSIFDNAGSDSQIVEVMR